MGCKLMKKIRYTTEVSTDDIRRIWDVSSFAHGRLPFIYLGVLICSRKIPVVEYSGIMEQMMARIKVWSSKICLMQGDSSLLITPSVP